MSWMSLLDDEALAAAYRRGMLPLPSPRCRDCASIEAEHSRHLVAMVMGMHGAVETALLFVPTGSRARAIEMAWLAYETAFRTTAESMSAAQQRHHGQDHGQPETT